MNPPCYNRETHTDCPRRCAGCSVNCKEWADYTKAKKDEYERRYLATKDSYRELPPKQRRKKQEMLNRNKR